MKTESLLVERDAIVKLLSKTKGEIIDIRRNEEAHVAYVKSCQDSEMKRLIAEQQRRESSSIK